MISDRRLLTITHGCRTIPFTDAAFHHHHQFYIRPISSAATAIIFRSQIYLGIPFVLVTDERVTMHTACKTRVCKWCRSGKCKTKLTTTHITARQRTVLLEHLLEIVGARIARQTRDENLSVAHFETFAQIFVQVSNGFVD